MQKECFQVKTMTRSLFTSACNMLLSLYAFLVLRDQKMIEKLSNAMGAWVSKEGCLPDLY